MNTPPHEDVPRYDFWLKLILGGTLALTFILALILISSDTTAAVVMFGITLFDALLFKTVLPRRYQIFEDRLRILMGWPFAVNIAFSNIEEAKPAPGGRAFAYRGLRFATSTRHVIEIVRNKGLNLVISPSKGDVFLDELNRAIKPK